MANSSNNKPGFCDPYATLIAMPPKMGYKNGRQLESAMRDDEVL